MPVYGTIASQFNDPGVNTLYHSLIGEINNQEYSVKTTKGFFSDKSGINESNKGSEKPYFRMTRELYMGYERNFSSRGMYSGQEEYYEDINQKVKYLDEQDYKHNRFYLNGLWKNGKESIIHERDVAKKHNSSIRHDSIPITLEQVNDNNISFLCEVLPSTELINRVGWSQLLSDPGGGRPGATAPRPLGEKGCF